MRLGSRVEKYFEVRRGLRQGCEMSSWLFNIFFDRIVRQVNERAVKLIDGNGGGCEIKQLLYAGEIVFGN